MTEQDGGAHRAMPRELSATIQDHIIEWLQDTGSLTSICE